MSDKERSCWYALFISIVTHKEAAEALSLMDVLKDGEHDKRKKRCGDGQRCSSRI